MSGLTSSHLGLKTSLYLQRRIYLSAWRFRYKEAKDCEILCTLQYSHGKMAITYTYAFRNYGGCRIRYQWISNCGCGRCKLQIPLQWHLANIWCERESMATLWDLPLHTQTKNHYDIISERSCHDLRRYRKRSKLKSGGRRDRLHQKESCSIT